MSTLTLDQLEEIAGCDEDSDALDEDYMPELLTLEEIEDILGGL